MKATGRRELFALLAGAGVVGLAHAGVARAEGIGAAASVTTAPASDADNLIQPSDTGVLPLSVRGADGQRPNLTEWSSADERVLTAITSRGAIHMTPAEADARAPFAWEVSAVPFDGVMNPTSYLGYNAGFGGIRVVPEEPSATYTIESDYFDGAKHTIEMYSEVSTERGAVTLRPFFWQIVRDATDPARAMTRASIMGDPLVVEAPGGGPLATIERSRVVVHGAAPGLNTGVSVRAGTGRVGYLGLGANDAHDVLMMYPTGRDHAQVNLNGRAILHLFSTPRGVPGSSISVGEVDNQAAGVFAVATNQIDVKALVARGRPSQRADLQEWQDHTGAPLAGVTPLGRPRWSRNNETSEPGRADGSASPLPSRPMKYLAVVDSGGQTLLVPAYASPPEKPQ